MFIYIYIYIRLPKGSRLSNVLMKLWSSTSRNCAHQRRRGRNRAEMATQSKDSEQLVQHPALLARNAGELKERASSSSPTTLVLLLVVPIVLVFFADFAFAVAMKSSEAQAGQRAAVKTTDTSSNGESASGGSGPDATVKDKRKTPMNQKCQSRKPNKNCAPSGHQQRSTSNPRTTEVMHMEP
ncbi:uncharacterized protein LOC142582213 isoform X3 [Dermacentor variabilis]|uniref:uncharacterized protein LOC142582213 isoform X3 n=1 Tax=Dermacentor variabilis TaxID=34621 RepID=UPI003F5BC4C1